VGHAEHSARVDLVASVIRQLGRTTSHTASFNHALAAQLGIGATDLECFALLVDLGPTSAGQLAEMLSLTTGAITGVVDRLEAAGFVVRDSDPNDRRRVIVRPVPTRMAELDRANEPVLRAAMGALTAYTNDDLRRLLDFHQSACELMSEQTSRLKAEHSRAAAGPTYTTQLGDVGDGSFEFAGGVSELRISANDRLDELYRAVFEGPQPVVRVRDGNVTFGYRRAGLFDLGKRSGSVALNPTISWAITLRGGASRTSVDARDLRLRGMAMSDGASNVEVSLSDAHGIVRICLDGGVNGVQIRRPVGVPAQVQVYGGANRLEFDGQRFGAIGGDVRLATPGWELERDGYDIEVRGGASRLGIHQV
jgi:DNA-binding MarR family transcriptional regulator